MTEHEISFFPKKRHIFINGEITEETHQKVLKSLRYLNEADGKKPITLFINTEGGGWDAARAISDDIRAEDMSAPVYGCVTGQAHSAGFIILQACDKRFAHPSALFMFHAPDLGGVRADAPYLRATIKEIQKEHEHFLRLIVGRSKRKMTLKEAREWSRASKEFSAQIALKNGLIDKIKKMRPTV